MENTLICYPPQQPSDLMTDEIWKPICGYEGLYECSSHGRVRSLDKPGVINNGKSTYPKLRKGIFLKQRITDWGYLSVTLCREGVCKYFVSHRLVAIAFIPNPENKETVNHIDGDKTNNNIDNLEWNTVAENIIHAVKNKLRVAPNGERSGKSKLTAVQAHRIRTLHEIGCEVKTIANMFRISVSGVRHVVARRVWNHI